MSALDKCEVIPSPEMNCKNVDHGSNDRLILATVLALISAVSYTFSNLGLREVAKPGNFDWAIWVTCLKAVPVSLAAWIIIFTKWGRGLTALPPRRLFLPLIMTGVMMQFGGNFLFQTSLGLGGLALTVPLCFSTIILTGAILGRMFLNERITSQVLLAIACLIISICCLSFGAEDATASIQKELTTTSIVLAILTATFAGVAYGTCGVVIRKMVSGNLPVSATVVLMCTTGVVCLGITSLFRLGWDQMMAITSHEFNYILLAGILNALAFFCVSNALKHAPVTFVNICNASQAAMAAVLGVLWFHEAFTGWLLTGTILTIVGIILMKKK